MLTASDSRLLGRLAAPFSFPVCFALTAAALGFPGFWLPPLSRPVLPASLGFSPPYASLHGLPGPHLHFCTDACLTPGPLLTPPWGCPASVPVTPGRDLEASCLSPSSAACIWVSGPARGPQGCV